MIREYMPTMIRIPPNNYFRFQVRCGASGVAVLLELSRMFYDDITENSWANEIWIVFFDAEDNGEIAVGLGHGIKSFR
jgi:hypothetical protein